MTEQPWYAVQAGDLKPVKPLTFVRVISQGIGYAVREWKDADGQLWHICPGYRAWAGTASDPQHNGC